MNAIVQFDQVDRSFGKNRTLMAVDFGVERGESVVIVGPDGSGKETIVLLAAGLDVPDRGAVTVNGLAAAARRTRSAGTLGLVLGTTPFGLRESVGSSIRLRARLHSLGGSLARQRCDELVATLGLSEKERDPIGVLGPLDAMRAEIAAAVVHHPDMLILHKPTAQLSSSQARDLIGDLKRLQRELGLAALWTSSRADDLRHADRVVLLRAGTVRFTGTPDALLSEAGQADIPAAMAKLIGEGEGLV